MSGLPHHPPKAKAVIHLFMAGAPSQLELFDYKPELAKLEGKPLPPSIINGQRYAFIRPDAAVLGPRYKFARHGQSGAELSEMIPHIASIADDIAIVKTLHTEEINHAPAQMFLHTGFGRGGRPSFGSWVTYGLGTENQDLPAYTVLLSGPLGGAGTSLWASGFLPSVHQGIQFRSSGDPVLFLSNPKGQSQDDRRRILRRRAVLLFLTPKPIAGQPGEPDRQIAARAGGRFAVHDPTP